MGKKLKDAPQEELEEVAEVTPKAKKKSSTKPLSFGAMLKEANAKRKVRMAKILANDNKK